MSRHLLLDRPDRQIFLGFDHPLQSFFGLVYRSGGRGGVWTVCGGWPTPIGLGIRSPISSSTLMHADLAELGEWAKAQIPDEFATEPMAAYHLGLLLSLLSLPARPCGALLADCLRKVAQIIRSSARL